MAQAEKEKNDKLREAKTNADQLINNIRREKEAEYAAAVAEVSEHTADLRRKKRRSMR